MSLEPDYTGTRKISGQGHSQAAAVGMAWVAAGVAVSKILSFVSQIILGYLLSVEHYAVFGLAAATLALVAGFQNSSIPKVLIQKGEDFDRFFPDYSSLAFQFGIMGAVILCGLGFGMQFYYDFPELFPVLMITAVSVPILAANTTLTADLSRSYRFRSINQAEVLRSFSYAIILVTGAWFGADVFTVAVSTVLAAAIAHLYLRKLVTQKPSYLRIRPRKFWDLLVSIRSAILAGFLFALAMRADFLVLGRLLTPETLGFYAFGFMLVASLMQPISTGINQVFLPIFAKFQTDQAALTTSLNRFTMAIVFIASNVCIILMAIAPWVIHVAWGGKWDGSQLAVVALLFAMPFRFIATIAGVGFEATGAWRLRNKLLVLQAVLLATCAGVGAAYGGLNGAILGVIIQRILSGIVDFAAFKHFLSANVWSNFWFLIRAYVPFCAGCAVLYPLLIRLVQQDVPSGADAALPALCAVMLITALTFVLNPALWRDSRTFGLSALKRR